MYQLNDIKENKIINNLIADLDRTSAQVNKPHESDAEIIRIGNLKLALTTDSISEEIASGLYSDPWLIGWMIVTVNMSDLAAVGAEPIGILISEIIPDNFSAEKLQQLQKGISEACIKYHTYVLGGDTNEGERLVLTGTAIGIINSDKILSRVICKPGELLYSSGKPGAGNAYAISKLIYQEDSFSNYRPEAKLGFSEIISRYASVCMDSSDGFISTLDQLMRLNEAGFQLTESIEKLIDEDSLNYIRKLNFPSWLLLAGQHGEFELIFTVSENMNEDFIKSANMNGFNPVLLGKVIPERHIKMIIYEEIVSIDSAYIRNLFHSSNGNVKLYMEKLLEYDNQLKQEPLNTFTFY